MLGFLNNAVQQTKGFQQRTLPVGPLCPFRSDFWSAEAVNNYAAEMPIKPTSCVRITRFTRYQYAVLKDVIRLLSCCYFDITTWVRSSRPWNSLALSIAHKTEAEAPEGAHDQDAAWNSSDPGGPPPDSLCVVELGMFPSSY